MFVIPLFYFSPPPEKSTITVSFSAVFTLYCKCTFPFLHPLDLVMHVYRVHAAFAPLQFSGGCFLYLFLLEECLFNSEEQHYFYMAASFEIALL